MRQLLPIVALMASTFFMLAGGGVQWTVLPLRAQAEGFSIDAIGIMGTSWAAGFTAGCLLAPHIVRRVGHVRAFSSLLALVAIAILLTGLMIHPAVWSALRAVVGLCFAGSYMVIESWLNERAANRSRGLVFSLYLVVGELGMIAGQYAIVFSDPKTPAPFMISAILFAAAILPTALSTAQNPAPIAQARPELRRLFANSPAAAVGMALAGALAGAWGSFAPVYGAQIGLTNAAISTLLASAMAGSAIAQFPIGWLSDRMDRRIAILAIGVAGATACWLAARMPVDAARPGVAFFALMAFVGAMIYPVYAVLAAHANDRAAPDEYVGIAAGLLLVYGLGTMLGPPAAARAIEAFGPTGIFVAMGATSLVMAAHTGWRMVRRGRPRGDAEAVRSLPAAAGPTPQTMTLAATGETKAP